MAQIFHRSTNTISRASIFGAVFLLGLAGWIFYDLEASPYTTEQTVAREQPIQFSHAHHAGAIGIDCRYCHTSVEKAAFAGIPPTKTCMNCHAQIWLQSPYPEPVRESFRTDRSIEWTRVHDLPDFVYFDHSIHIAKGVACMECHGRVDQMPITWRIAPLEMQWCLACHRNPGPHLHEPDGVFAMHAREPLPARDIEQLMQRYHIQSVRRLTDCSTCHR